MSATVLQRKLTPHEERAVAVEAGCDPRTVRKALDGESYSTTTVRVLAALTKLGLACPLHGEMQP